MVPTSPAVGIGGCRLGGLVNEGLRMSSTSHWRGLETGSSPQHLNVISACCQPPATWGIARFGGQKARSFRSACQVTLMTVDRRLRWPYYVGAATLIPVPHYEVVECTAIAIG